MNRFHRQQQISGFSLVELMVAMVIGLFLIGGVLYVFLGGSRSYDINSNQTHMLDNARLVMDTIGRDLRMAGSWGRGGDTNMIDWPMVNMPAMGGDCANVNNEEDSADWYYQVRQRLTGANNQNPYNGSCLQNQQNGSYLANTDVLGIRYALPNAIADTNLTTTMAYLQVGRVELADGTTNNNGASNMLFVFDGNASSVPTVGPNNNYQLQALLYYVANTDVDGQNIPSLWRLRLGPAQTGNAPALMREMVAQGVEQFQVQYGIDSTGDGAANTYVNADSINWADFESVEQIVAVRVWLLMRSVDPMDQPGARRTYTMGDVTVQLAANDQFQRVLVSSVFQLRSKVVSL